MSERQLPWAVCVDGYPIGIVYAVNERLARRAAVTFFGAGCDKGLTVMREPKKKCLQTPAEQDKI